MQSRSFNGWSWGDRNSSRSSLRCHCSPSSLDLLQVTITDMFFHQERWRLFWNIDNYTIFGYVTLHLLWNQRHIASIIQFWYDASLDILQKTLFYRSPYFVALELKIPKKSEPSTSVKQFAFSISSFQETVCIRVQKLFWTERADSEWSHNKLKLTTPYLRDWVTRLHEQRLASILPVGRSFSPVLFQRAKIIMMITLSDLR